MPVPACLRLADEVFPQVRAEAARRLVGQGWTQTRIATALGVSQAMVSKYTQRDAGEDDPLVLRLTEDLIFDLEDPRPALGASAWCHTLSVSPDRPGADVALADLLSAERRLLAAAPLAIMPQVGLNLARATPGATAPEDILAYPARITDAGDRLARPAPPAFGASRHLARCLLSLREHAPSLHALGNVRGGPDVRRAAEGVAGLVEMDGAAETDREALFARTVAADPGPLVHDPGAFGIEPCLYVAGRDAAEVVARILKIHSRLEK